MSVKRGQTRFRRNSSPGGQEPLCLARSASVTGGEQSEPRSARHPADRPRGGVGGPRPAGRQPPPARRPRGLPPPGGLTAAPLQPPPTIANPCVASFLEEERFRDCAGTAVCSPVLSGRRDRFF